jgi:hypothetical protein
MIDAATSEIEEVIKSFPDSLTGNEIVAQIYRSEGNLEKAFEVCWRLISSVENEEIIDAIDEIKKDRQLRGHEDCDILRTRRNSV